MLVDKVKIFVRAGKGGDGCESYENRGPRKYYPTGGNGGKGGAIIFRAETNVRDLEHFKFNPRIIGKAGVQGSSNRKAGKKGTDVICTVPVGTTIYSAADDYLIRDLIHHGDEVILARGSNPGRGNQDNRTATKGKPGQELEAILDYTIFSDIALIGLANSGKTSLLARLSNAKVEGTDYPFSTTAPQLGSYECEDYKRLILLDLPSLIKGSSEGKGIGNRFLKHALRAQLFFIVLDARSDFSENICSAVEILQDELRIFNDALVGKPFFLVLNKCDIADEKDLKKDKERLKKKYKNVYNVSTYSGAGIDVLMKEARKQLPN
jgi:GTP-binding protein